jgi:hypothetical protein
MTTKVQAVKRSIVSLKLERPTPKLIAQGTALVSSMTSNPNFATPNPPLATVTAAITALQAAETAVKARTHGAVANRNAQQKALTTLLEQTRSYIQSVADSNSDTAETVIKSAGVAVRAAVIRQKQVFAVEKGPVSGSVKLTTAAEGDRASYEWQYGVNGGTSTSGRGTGVPRRCSRRARTRPMASDARMPTSVVR